MAKTIGTAWIQNLNKAELIAVCKANNIEVSDETVNELRILVREYVKQKIVDGKSDDIKTFEDLIKSENSAEADGTSGNNTSEVKSVSDRAAKIKKMEVSANLDFDVKKDDWEQYVDRMEQHFVANDVDDENKKRAILLSKVNADTYELIAKICKPDKPKAKSFTEIVELVKNYLKPPASYLVYRSKFRQRFQKSTESISEYVAVLK